ncbi:MAG TPA: hypothetical protein VJH91_01065 [Candidatus Paceibacterota bacterium]
MLRKDLKEYTLPDEPGIYMFRKGTRKRPGKILYIGKAASLRDRARSYFAAALHETRSPAISKMVADATVLTWQVAGSVLEALILEANLIKRHGPQYNVDEKDNKSFNYLVVTKEPARPDASGRSGGDFPRVLVVRGRELYQSWNDKKMRKLFGPFPQGGSLAEAIKIVRKIFPFRDKCTPQIGKPCFNRQIGLCPGVCTGEVSKENYAKTIRNIEELFSGNFKGLKRRLTSEMKAAAEGERYEVAAQARRQVHALEHIRDVSLIKSVNKYSLGGPRRSHPSSRIEAYDVAHTAGTETVGVMSVIEDGEPRKAEYRMFKIRGAGNNDIGALIEMLNRRLGHPEWPLPRIVAIDGGVAQLRAAERIFKNAGLLIPIVGVVKNESHKPARLIGDVRARELYEKEILLANAEAHRFSISWHRKRLRKRM